MSGQEEITGEGAQGGEEIVPPTGAKPKRGASKGARGNGRRGRGRALGARSSPRVGALRSGTEQSDPGDSSQDEGAPDQQEAEADIEFDMPPVVLSSR